MKEIDRVNRFLEVPVSNFSGHARYLRGLCAAVPFSSVEPRDDPQIDDLFELCEGLWWAMFYREMIDDLKLVQSPDAERWQQRFAAMTSLLNAMQSDLMSIEQAEERVNRIFAPFSREVIEPALGISTKDVVSGFRVVRAEIVWRLEASRELMVPVHDVWQEFRRRSFSGESEAELDAFVSEHHEKTSQKLARASTN